MGTGMRRTIVAACAVTSIVLGAADVLLLGTAVGIGAASFLCGAQDSVAQVKAVSLGDCVGIDETKLPWQCFDLSCVCVDVPPGCDC